MFYKMVHLKRQPGEMDAVLMQGSTSKIELLKHLHGFVDWDRYYFKIVFAWGGHVARLTYDRKRITFRVLQHKSWQWILRISSENGGNQFHGRKVKVFRWLQVFYEFYGDQKWWRAARTNINGQDFWMTW